MVILRNVFGFQICVLVFTFVKGTKGCSNALQPEIGFIINCNRNVWKATINMPDFHQPVPKLNTYCIEQNPRQCRLNVTERNITIKILKLIEPNQMIDV